MRFVHIVALGCAWSAAAGAQDRPADMVVPAHTEIAFRLNEEVSSQRARVGQVVPVSVARDVIVDGMVLIPRGTAGTGVVTGRTGKGAFGKSGKVDIALRSVAIAGRPVAIAGRFHAAGEGRAGETIGSILVGGVVAGAFVTGRHAVFEEGREFVAFTTESATVPQSAVRKASPAPLVAYAGTVPAPVLRYATTGPMPAPAVQLVDLEDTTFASSPRYDTMRRLERRIAQAQPVRGGDRRQGWTISD
ncbi:hypothetical protein [Sphingomonas melonis]|uniref:Uncharacterized protein n=1 Tax=Sphingomonas melonis TaxID=152682 RepID=A0A7Y9FQV9_9SPHN|nr:hypothetical protein [Sphingomonas melonis]NYD91648.1 hypothetical protein [Sphingomonas melonis]